MTQPLSPLRADPGRDERMSHCQSPYNRFNPRLALLAATVFPVPPPILVAADLRAFSSPIVEFCSTTGLCSCFPCAPSGAGLADVDEMVEVVDVGGRGCDEDAGRSCDADVGFEVFEVVLRNSAGGILEKDQRKS